MQILFTMFIPVFVQHSPDWLNFRYCTLKKKFPNYCFDE